MILAILADEILKQELLAKKIPGEIEVIWADSVRALTMIEADVYIDLLFEMDAERTAHLKRLLPKPVLINAVPYATKSIGGDFIRINAWPTLFQRPITEIAIADNINTDTVKNIFEQLQWPYQLAPDIPGMITARVLVMIVNEAYYTLGGMISCKF